MKIILATIVAALANSMIANAQPIARVGEPTSPISSLVVVPAGSELVFVSGATAPAPPGGGLRTGDTEAQTVAALSKIADLLKAQRMSVADIVMLRVYLVADPNKGGVVDRDGMTAGYKQFFGTAAQPNKPARTTIQVAGMGQGGLVEIDAQAVRTH